MHNDEYILKRGGIALDLEFQVRSRCLESLLLKICIINSLDPPAM